MKSGNAARKLTPPSVTAEFAQRAQQGDTGALDYLVERIHTRLYRFCLFLTGNAPAAQDLCQDAYLKLLEKLHTLKEPKAFVNWLFELTRHHFFDYLRSPRSRGHLELSDFPEALFAHAAKNDVTVQLKQMFERLKPDERFVLLLVHLEGRTYAEAAVILGVAEETVRSKLYRIKKSFKSDFLTHTHNLPAARR